MTLRDLLRILALRNKLFLNKAADISEVEKFVSDNKVVSVGHELVRVGSDRDGGYLLPDVMAGIEKCFSPGVDVSSDFEDELAERFGMKCYLADYSVDGPASENPSFHFDKKFLGVQNNDQFIRLEDWVEKYAATDTSDLLLQMDIEGAEFAVLLDTPQSTLKRFRMMAIEFHSMETAFEIGAFPMIKSAFDKLAENFTIAHIHTNNYQRIWKRDNVEIPSVMEITFLRNDFVKRDGKALTFPHPLDELNEVNKPPRHLPKCWWPL
ncbi:MAG: FkbM family methyltransferase [Lentilitoribacter sp.]